MGTYGDGGNAAVLRQRLRLRGIAAEIVEITLADPVPDSLDLYTLGGAEDYAQRLATKHLIRTRDCSAPRAEARRCWRSARPFRCSGTGMKRRRGTGRRRGHAGRDHVTTTGAHHRRAGDHAAAGRVDRAVDRFRKPPRRNGSRRAASPLGAVKKGAGNRAGNGIDGAVQGSVFATYMHGPCLARNPEFADLLLGKVVGDLAPLDLPEVELLRRERFGPRGAHSIFVSGPPAISRAADIVGGARLEHHLLGRSRCQSCRCDGTPLRPLRGGRSARGPGSARRRIPGRRPSADRTRSGVTVRPGMSRSIRTR